MRTALLIIQVASYVALGALFFTQGNWRLGVAQWLLACVQGVLFS